MRSNSAPSSFGFSSPFLNDINDDGWKSFPFSLLTNKRFFLDGAVLARGRVQVISAN